MDFLLSPDQPVVWLRHERRALGKPCAGTESNGPRAWCNAAIDVKTPDTGSVSFTFGSEQLYRVDTFYGGNTDTNALFSGTNHASLTDELYNISSEPDAHDFPMVGSLSPRAMLSFADDIATSLSVVRQLAKFG